MSLPAIEKASSQLRAALCALALFGVGGLSTPAIAAPLPGAIFTSDSTCSGVDLNIYAAKEDVYLDGGPAHLGAASLPDGSYYVKVTNPGGDTLLGTSIGTANERPVTVAGGVFSPCLQLMSAALVNGGGTGPGYDDTNNPGGEYKVWVSNEASFTNSSTKTDNFKVKSNVTAVARLIIAKFYDANANGVHDPGELAIEGWVVGIAGCITDVRETTADLIVEPGTCSVTEASPIQTNWIGTTPNPVSVVLAAGDTKTVDFGNVCLGAGGGLTLGYWSNKNGQANFTGANLALLTTLNLRRSDGSVFDPASYTDFRNWLLSASATNMAYMLSAQLAAMELNAAHGLVNIAALIYAPGTTSASALGFATLGAVMAEADASLGAHGLTLSGDAERPHQQALKNALDSANNNFNFVQAAPCSFTFP